MPLHPNSQISYCMSLYLIIVCCLYVIISSPTNTGRLLIDDLGWNDVSFHGGSDFLTPHLDDLQSQAIRLNNYYVQHYCTPTRSALMSGRYPMRDGLQQWIIRPAAPYGMPLHLRTMPEILKDIGYTTHMLGYEYFFSIFCAFHMKVISECLCSDCFLIHYIYGYSLVLFAFSSIIICA